MIESARLLLIRLRYYYLAAAKTCQENAQDGIIRPEDQLLVNQYLRCYRFCYIKLHELLKGKEVY